MQDEGLVRFGLVGLGGWGEHIALATQRRPDVEITRCYARSPESRGAFAARHGCIPCADYEEMLTDPAIRGIIVMSANRAHREQVVAAARAGKHCLVTKPMATSIEDGCAMIDACPRGRGHPHSRAPEPARACDTGAEAGARGGRAGHPRPGRSKHLVGRRAEHRAGTVALVARRMYWRALNPIGYPPHRHTAIPARAHCSGAGVAAQDASPGRNRRRHGDAVGIRGRTGGLHRLCLRHGRDVLDQDWRHPGDRALRPARGPDPEPRFVAGRTVARVPGAGHESTSSHQHAAGGAGGIRRVHTYRKTA